MGNEIIEVVGNSSVYEGLEKEHRDLLIAYSREIRRSGQRTSIEFAELCRNVCEAHDLLVKVGCKGGFKQWIEEVGVSRSSAYEYIDVWRTFGKVKHIAQFEPAALITLSKSGVEIDAQKEAINEAKTVPMTNDRAKELGKCPKSDNSKPQKNKGLVQKTDLEYEDTETDRQPGEDDEELPEDKPSKQPPVIEKPEGLIAPIQAVATLLDKLLRELKALHGEVGGEWLEMASIEKQAIDLKGLIRSGVHWVACPECDGKKGGCNTCKHHGWLSKARKMFLTQPQKDKLGVS